MIFASVIESQNSQSRNIIVTAHLKTLEAAGTVHRCCLFSNVDQFYCKHGFNELRSSTFRVNVNTGKYLIKEDDFIFED